MALRASTDTLLIISVHWTPNPRPPALNPAQLRRSKVRQREGPSNVLLQRGRHSSVAQSQKNISEKHLTHQSHRICLLYTSDAADDM
eukprot:3854954-Rhodomonas_salina.2